MTVEAKHSSTPEPDALPTWPTVMMTPVIDMARAMTMLREGRCLFSIQLPNTTRIGYV